jgi:hypothetical protein
MNHRNRLAKLESGQSDALTISDLLDRLDCNIGVERELNVEIRLSRLLASLPMD